MNAAAVLGRAVLVLLLAGCASAAPPVQPARDFSASIEREASLLETGRKLIGIGSYSSIIEALQLLREGGAGSTEQGRELEYVGLSLLQAVYPLQAEGAAPSAPRFGSIYPEIFERVRDGIYPFGGDPAPDGLPAIVSLAAIFFTGDEEVLRSVYAAALELISRDPELLLPRLCTGLFLERTGDYTGAEDAYKKVREADEKSYPALIGLINIYVKTLYRREAEELLDELISRFPENRSILTFSINGYIRIEAFQKADRAAVDALARFPDDLQLLAGRAVILEYFGRDEQARRLLRVIEGRKGDTAETYFVRIRLASKEGRLDQAFSLLEEAQIRYPDEGRFRELYGKLLYDAGRMEEVRTYLTEMLEDDPHSIFSLELLLREAVSGRRWQEAENYLERIMNIRESDEYFRLGITIYGELGDSEAAFQAARTLYRKGPDIFLHFSLYGEHMIAAGRPEEAVQLIDQRLTVEQNSDRRSELFYLKSLARQELDDKLNNLRQALLENLRNVRAMVAIADVYERLGEYRQAARYLRQALAQDPNNPAISEALGRIDDRTR